jgi:hypothetical protein
MAGPPSGNARGGSPSADGSAVYPGIDPLRPQPPPGSQPPSGEASDPPPERPPEYATQPKGARKRIAFRGGGDAGEPGDSSAPGDERFATPSYRPQPPRKSASLRPGWVHGGRDWIIYVECRADGVVLYPAEKRFPLAEAARPASGNPLVAAIKQMIDRRQSLRRPGEPPYYPQVRLLVRPENVYTFLTVYPALEALPVPKKRQNLQPEDDVRDIVTESNP